MLSTDTLLTWFSCNGAVQRSDGQPPFNVVGSELALMFELVFYSKLRQRLCDGKTVEQRQLASMKFCEDRKVPKQFWVYVHVPVDVLMDNDKRHAQLKRYNSRPRDSQLGARITAWKHELSAQKAPHIRLPSEPEPAPEQQQADFEDLRGQGPAAGVKRACSQAERERASQKRQRELYYITQQRLLREYHEQHGHPYIAMRIWLEAVTNPRYVCFTAINYLPQAPNSPEKNMVAEHPMFTIKSHAYKIVRSLRADFEALRKGVTIDDAIDAGFNERMGGQPGLWHIKRSREKLSCCLQLLAGAKGEVCLLHYIFDRWRNYCEQTGALRGPDPGRGGHPVHDANKIKVHRVKATGGGWITDRKWT